MTSSHDWRDRYRLVAHHGRLARGNPTRGLLLSNATGVYQLYGWQLDGDELTQLTERPSGVRGGEISGDGRWVYYLDDAGGNEIGQFVRVPSAGGSAEPITPDLPPYSSFGVSCDVAGRTVAFVAAGTDGFTCYVVPMDGDAIGAPRRVLHRTALLHNAALSYSGEYTALQTLEGRRGLNFALLAVDNAAGEVIGALADGDDAAMALVAFAPLPGDTRLLCSSTASGDTRPLVWDVRTGDRHDVAVGALTGSVRPLGWSPDGRQVVMLHTASARRDLYVSDLVSGDVRAIDLGGGTVQSAAFIDNATLLVRHESATTPGRMLIVDVPTGRVTDERFAHVDVPSARPWQSVSFTSSDGQAIQGWLCVPEGDGPFPTVLDMHGGPDDVQTEVYSGGAQCWVEHGFAFLTINYRGSTTFGPAFEQQIYGDLGHWEVEDMIAARNWLVESGIADPARILLTGWSYGGYLTLLALGRAPERWAGGMAGIAIADWALLHEDASEMLQGYQEALFGGSPAEQPERHAAASPSTYAAQVQAPVLVIQGSNDTRCPPRQMRAYEAQMRELGKDIRVIWFSAGHGSADTSDAIRHQEAMLEFALPLVQR